MKIDLEGIVGRGSLDITDKLNECRYFLALMKGTTDWAQFRWLTSAYLNAAHSAMDWLAWGVHHAWFDDEGDPHTSEKALQALSPYMKAEERNGKFYSEPRHTLLKELSTKYRKMTAHVGPLSIKPEKVADAGEFLFRDGGKPVLAFGEQVLELLVKIQQEVIDSW